MKKMITGTLVMIVLIMFVSPCAYSGTSKTFGRYIEISHDEFFDGNIKVTQYIVYDKDTHVVYVYMTDGAGMFAITPYLMRDVFGELTVGIYNIDGGYIEPMEPYLDEYGEEWVIAG